eukprot:TRINITY_DN2559_c0_g3_i1.p1 TRINITY_DN2559_c0_g3~~TRINITY_DN2559_c0_g3_i1.p1  ORF type:complete len:287 (+),score=47.03 TRINITY_DN2559_c0_g3_i1:45-863(+)
MQITLGSPFDLLGMDDEPPDVSEDDVEEDMLLAKEELSEMGLNADFEGLTAVLRVGGIAIEVVDLFMRAGVTVKGTDEDGLSVAHICSEKGEADIMRHIIECRGTEFELNNAEPSKGYHPIHMAGSEEVVFLLTEFGVSPNQVSSGETVTYPLCAATMSGNVKVVKALLRCGANLSTSSKILGCVVSTPCFTTREKQLFLTYLVRQGSNVRSQSIPPLMCTTCPQLTKHLLSLGADPNESLGGCTVYDAMVSNKASSATLRYLIKAGAKPRR